jgi:hypothetical protein
MDDPRLSFLVSQFTPEGLAGNPPIGFGDQYLFFVGYDDCHGILHHLIPLEKLMFKLNMFGFDDDELNGDILGLFTNPQVHVQGTLDRSQAGGVHEKKLILFNQQHDPVDWANSFVVGQSATKDISHTKGGVFASLGIGFEGSMNWSNSGEGTGINLKPGKQPAGFHAQNNTLLLSTNPVFLSRFSARLDIEHAIARSQ